MEGCKVVENKNVNRDGDIAYARGRKRICGNALRCSILSFPRPVRTDPADTVMVCFQGTGVLTAMISRVRTRFGAFIAKDAGQDAPVQVNEVVQTNLRVTPSQALRARR